MTRRKDGLYQQGVTVNDKRHYFYGRTKNEVLRKIREFKEEKTTGVLFSKIASEWEKVHQEAVEYNAHHVYIKPLKDANAEFGNTNIKQITPAHIDSFLKRIAAKGYAKRTVKIYLSMFNLIYNFAILNGYADYNPASSVKVSAKLPAGKRTLPSIDEIEAIKKGRSAHFGLFAFFLLYTGMRRGEALAITYNDIDFENKTITINKSLYWEENKPVIKGTKTEAGKRTIVLLDILAENLPHGTGYVFGGKAPMTRSAFRKAWERYKKETGATFTPHQLRHLFATILYESGIDEKLAQELMGHSSITVTHDIYTHIRRERLAYAAQLLNEKLAV